MKSLIVAVDEAWGMGNRGEDRPQPVFIPEDLGHFKRKTTGNTVLTGRRTYDTFPRQPLPDRNTILLSEQGASSLHSKYGEHDSLYFANSLDDALRTHDEDLGSTDLYVAGGKQVYDDCLRRGFLDSAFVTRFPRDFDCDIAFPAGRFKGYNWRKTDEEHVSIDTGKADFGGYKPFGSFTIEVYER